jgi:PAS domain S-box-containing protein
VATYPSPFVGALVVAAFVAAGLATVGYRNRDVNGGLAFAAMMGAVALWAYGDAAQLTASDWTAYRDWAALSFVASVTAVTAGFVFVLRYTGNDHWVTRGTLALLAVEPTAAVLLAWTNARHELMWRYTGELRTTPVTWAPVENAVGFDAHLAYTYALLAVLLGLLLRFYLRSRGTYRWQTLVMLVGAAVPIATNVVWLVVQNRLPTSVDPTPVTLTVTGLLFTVGLRSFDFLELAPVGRHTVVEDLHEAVLTVDDQDRIVDANPAARELLAAGGSLVGEDAPAVVPGYDRLGPGDGEAADVAMTVDGERRYFDVRGSTLAGAPGTAPATVVMLRDVTERRRVEERYQQLIENATDLITVLDGDGRIRYESPSVETVLGYEPEQMRGTSAFGYVHPEDREHVVEQFESLLEEPDGELRATYRMRTADGSFRKLESRGRNLLDDPVVEGVVVNSRDITERRERERRLEQRNEQLEEFASVVSHDLRNPLSVAHGYARLLDDEHDDERLGKVVAAHERMEELIDDLLTLAKEGRAVSEPDPVDVEEAAHQAWAIVDTTGATLTVDDPRSLMADDTRLRQLLENLFANACEHGVDDGATGDDDATADGGTVEVRVGTTDGGFYVADDGPGIPPERRDAIFDAGQSEGGAGIGLGLTIVQRIAEAHGWTVDVRGSESGGTRFEFDGVEWAP